VALRLRARLDLRSFSAKLPFVARPDPMRQRRIGERLD
jgi:hypothetical protein